MTEKELVIYDKFYVCLFQVVVENKALFGGCFKKHPNSFFDKLTVTPKNTISNTRFFRRFHS